MMKMRFSFRQCALVSVLQEALARDDVKQSAFRGVSIRKSEAEIKAKAFIQNIHHFRDEYISNNNAPVEKIIIFDEAQRAWTKEQTSSFMKRRRGMSGFDLSEPELLIDAMDRHTDWSVVICLIGGGQEINNGEAGMSGWFDALSQKFRHWKIWVSPELQEFEYNQGNDLYASVPKESLNEKKKLHLSVSIRSFRSENVSKFVKYLLDLDERASDCTCKSRISIQ